MSAAHQRQFELAARRERLVALAAIQRIELRMHFATLAPAMGVLASGWSAWHWVTSRPLQVGLPLLALLLLRPRRAWRWAIRLLPLVRLLPMTVMVLRVWRLSRASARPRD